MATKTGRNDPCPCGSGKKYKHCCLSTRAQTPNEFTTEIEAAMSENDFESLEDANAFLRQLTTKFNARAVDDFHGLSRMDMNHVLYAPFDSPDFVRFPDVLDTEPAAPVMVLFDALVDGIQDDGAKATAKGFLPAKLCRDIAARYQPYFVHDWEIEHIHREADFHQLHILRLVATDAGLIRKYKGRFLLTRRCRTILDSQGAKGIYPVLFQQYVERYNWAYADGYDEIPFIQQAFLFTLYLLDRYRDEFHPSTFFEEAFLQAFPAVIDEVTRPLRSAEETAASAYSLRTLRRFAWFFGLIEIKGDTKAPPHESYELRATPLLAEVVQFQRTFH